MTNNEPVIIAESTEVSVKENKVKEFFKSPKKLAIAAGATALAVAAVVVFALKRSDEEDFETEFPTEPAALDDTIV